MEVAVTKAKYANWSWCPCNPVTLVDDPVDADTDSNPVRSILEKDVDLYLTFEFALMKYNRGMTLGENNKLRYLNEAQSIFSCYRHKYVKAVLVAMDMTDTMIPLEKKPSSTKKTVRFSNTNQVQTVKRYNVKKSGWGKREKRTTKENDAWLSSSLGFRRYFQSFNLNSLKPSHRRRTKQVLEFISMVPVRHVHTLT